MYSMILFMKKYVYKLIFICIFIERRLEGCLLNLLIGVIVFEREVGMRDFYILLFIFIVLFEFIIMKCIYDG